MFWHYAWQGINSHGKRVSGISKDRLKTLKNNLIKQNIHCLSIKPVFSKKEVKISNSLLTEFIDQLHTLQKSGIPLHQSLLLIAESSKNTSMIEFCGFLSNRIQQGQSFAKSLMEFGHKINPVVCQMIAIGEQSGTLITMLKQARDFLLSLAHIKSTWLKAISYPLFVLSVAILITQFMLLFIVPKFNDFFADAEAKLPLLTRIVIHSSEIFYQIGLTLFFSIFLIILITIWLWKRKTKASLFIEKIILTMPWIGPFLESMQINRITHILATTLKAGMPLDQALKISSNTSVWQSYQIALLKTEQYIRQGKSLTYSLQITKLFSKNLLARVAIGEQSGQLETMLFHIADEQQYYLQKNISHLSKWLEPVIMLIIGIVVGTIMIAMYLPILQMNSLF